jgi:hypothetical protein
MKHNHEIHGNLARLLATENLNIEHKNVETAMFDVKSRTLTLPLWEKASDVLYQLLISHECAHAIFTPDVDTKTLTKVPHAYINVVEDARIEKLMKRKYPGLKKIFYSGYNEFCENDFFELKNVDISTLGFADKVNIFFKSSNFYSFNFSEKEKEIIELIENSETFDDAIYASEVLYKYCDKKDEVPEEISSLANQEGSELREQEGQTSSSDTLGNLENTSDESNESNVNNSNNSKSQDSSKANTNQQVTSGGNTKDYRNNSGKSVGTSQKNDVIKTMESYQKSVNNLNKDTPSKELVYLTIPTLKMDNILVSNKKIHSQLKQCWSLEQTKWKEVDADYLAVKKSSSKEVNYLIKEFECKKAAESYARASESKTGILDSNLLNTYKFNDDIFKKITTVMDGKNHGLIFILDWSGSMSNIMLDTCKQLYNLIWFCKKVNIPFEVYAFTTNYGSQTGQLYVKQHNTLGIYGPFNLLNLISSKVNTFTLDLHMKHIYRLAYYFSIRNYNSKINIPGNFCLSGTPLNETLLCLHHIIPEFQKTTKVHKVQCVVLTDGECSNLPRHDFNFTHASVYQIGGECYLKDLKLKTTYKFPDLNLNGYYSDDHKFTEVLLRNLRDNFPSVNFIGIRLLETYGSSSFISKYSQTDRDCQIHISEWKKNKSCSIKTNGYHTYFGLSSNSLHDNSQFNVNSGASTADIKTAFKKVLSSKKTNKKILSDFIDLIA